MLRYLNRDRRNNGLPPVRMQEDLRAVARKHSLDMAEKDYFDHVNQQHQAPHDRLRLAGVTEVVSGENLAKIGGYPNATQKAEDGLMHSPGHRANILNRDYNAVGIGVIQDSRGVYYFTQNFARRALLFRRKFPQTVRRGRSLRITGQAFMQVQSLLWQVRIPHTEKVEREGGEQLEEGRFDFQVPFDTPGRYEVFLFTGGKNDRTYTLANHFEVTVRRGWW